MADERTILLCGMMGAGKSSVGRLLAERLGFDFLDTDRCVESEAGCTVAELFGRRGEAIFRELERRVLAGLPATGAVVALGGGAVATAESRALLADKGTLVWLDASAETLAARVGDGAGRPLVAGLGEAARVTRLRDLAQQRATAYGQAALRVSTDERTPGEVCDAVLAGLATIPDVPAEGAR